MDCGPTCLRMVARYYGKHYNTDTLRQMTGFSKAGVSMLGISEAAERIGFKTRGVKLTYEVLIEDAPLPCILHWSQDHFVVLLPPSKWKRRNELKIADPGQGIISIPLESFKKHWISSVNDNDQPVGAALFLEPTVRFYESEGEEEKKVSWRLVLQYLKHSRWAIFQVFIALLITSLLQLIFPYLTQSIVDIGINTQNLQYITIVLFAQLMLIFSRTIIDFIRSRLLLNISIVINLSILSDFWMKLTKLPISYFDSHHAGDTLQRVGDNKVIQGFLTGSALNTIFSLLNFIIFSLVLVLYNSVLFAIFLGGSILYFLWILLFLRIRRKLNYQTFDLSAKENNATLQLVQGMQEIRLNNAERLKRWEWENIQVGISKLNFKMLSYAQLQQAGALLINQGKDLFITFLVARLVIEGRLTFGAMLAVQYILGQLSGPIEQFIGFVQAGQDAKISMERLNEIHQLKDEEDTNMMYSYHLPENKSISLNGLSFTYPGVGNEIVLDDISLHIPEGKVTAIVGISGSGKSTLLKMLLKFYDHYKGDIMVGQSNFKYISPSFWRRQCGSVTQDGYIFNDTIARNIAVSEETSDLPRLIECCKMANVLSFVESLPNGFYTKLGSEGVGISQGQKQRLLIARAIYKDPHYIFLDEATNALDANNEKVIVENLQHFFRGRTVIVVAHRLSTVKNADKIVVLHEGRIAEEGTHEQLSTAKGRYFELVKNQLELGT
jgi:ATP-binding cassette subfamily B protein